MYMKEKPLWNTFKEEHEKICDVDDVIYCGTEETQCINNTPHQQSEFLSNFNLFNENHPPVPKIVNQSPLKNGDLSNTRLRRLARRNRATFILGKCAGKIPLSSPAGLHIIKSTCTGISSEYVHERLERQERCCTAPPIGNCLSKPRFMDRRMYSIQPMISFRKPHDYRTTHEFKFPYQSYSKQRRKEAYLKFNANLLKQCQPVFIKMIKLSEEEIKEAIRRKPKGPLNRSNTGHIMDYINLCSSDEEDTEVPIEEEIITISNNQLDPLSLKSPPPLHPLSTDQIDVEQYTVPSTYRSSHSSLRLLSTSSSYSNQENNCSLINSALHASFSEIITNKELPLNSEVMIRKVSAASLASATVNNFIHIDLT